MGGAQVLEKGGRGEKQEKNRITEGLVKKKIKKKMQRMLEERLNVHKGDRNSPGTGAGGFLII